VACSSGAPDAWALLDTTHPPNYDLPNVFLYIGLYAAGFLTIGVAGGEAIRLIAYRGKGLGWDRRRGLVVFIATAATAALLGSAVSDRCGECGRGSPAVPIVVTILGVTVVVLLAAGLWRMLRR
jgi:hypothetical protein